MNVQKYQAILAVLEAGSISKAAERLNYTQSAVSQAIQSVEREWGFQVIERSRGKMVLTATAQMLLPYLQEICSAQRSVEDIVSRIGGVETGLIRIASIVSLSCYWLPPVLKEFCRRYPHIQFTLQQGGYSELQQLLQQGAADLAIGMFSAAENCEEISLGQDRTMAVLPPGHPLAQLERIPLERLAKEPFILLEEGGSNLAEILFRSHHIKPNIRLRIHDNDTVMSLVESGMGVSILSSLMLHRSPFQIAVREIETTIYRNLSAICRKDRCAAPAVECFWEFLKRAKKLN